MTRGFLVRSGVAGVMALGLTIGTVAQDPATLPQPSTDARLVTVQGCLERDFLYSPTTAATTIAGTPNPSPTPFKLTHVEIIKDEPVSTTGAATGAIPAQAAAPKDRNVELHVTAARDASVDLDGQVNQKVEILGTMTSKDLMNARGTGPATAGAKAPPLMLKATSVMSLGDKCQ